tara:strand:+ start:596 stop:835 length:240 start_codon:yes stop_codon:yes gene_type:complete
MATNYDNIGNKSVWDLYVENFRNELWDLAPEITWDEKGIRVVSSPWDEVCTANEVVVLSEEETDVQDVCESVNEPSRSE